MTPYMKFIHIWSVNIILLMFIFGAIGYIFNEHSDKRIITSMLFRYYHFMFLVAILTGIAIIAENIFWIRLPIFQYKIFVVSSLALLSVFHLKILKQKSNIRSIVTILLVICIYSISMIIGSYAHI